MKCSNNVVNLCVHFNVYSRIFSCENVAIVYSCSFDRT